MVLVVMKFAGNYLSGPGSHYGGLALHSSLPE